MLVGGLRRSSIATMRAEVSLAFWLFGFLLFISNSTFDIESTIAIQWDAARG